MPLYEFQCAQCGQVSEYIVAGSDKTEKQKELYTQSEAEEKQQSETSIQISENESSVTYSTGKPSTTPLTLEEKQKIEDAWEMLKNFSLEIEK